MREDASTAEEEPNRIHKDSKAPRRMKWSMIDLQATSNVNVSLQETSSSPFEP